MGIAAVIAVIPPDEGEIKKPFRRTPRATRLLAASFVIAILEMRLSTGVASAILANISVAEVRLLAVSAIGLVGLLTVPLKLMLANLLLLPVEAFFRWRFIGRAKAVMAQIQPKVIGVTGSYGKTTTKNFIADILNGRYHTYPTPKSYNTLMGICIAINNDLTNNYAIDYFIVEMGAYFQGEIRRICNLTPPDISVVVEIGPQHLERFGTLENTAISKYEIIKALKPDGVGIFNWDNPYVRQMYERGYPNNRIAVSKTISPDPDTVPPNGPRLIAGDIHETLDGLTFTVTDVQTRTAEKFITRVVGEHNVINILLATAVALYEGMTLKDVAFQVGNLKPSESRLVRQITPEGITIINDAYSANPAGVVSALKVLGMHDTGRRLLITPGMVELANLHETENRKLGQTAADYATDIILVGKERTEPIKTGLTDVHFPSDHLQIVETLTEAVNWYKSNLKTGDTVLFLNDLPDTY
ncbi:MAG TPA: UDP-N-acetylmuramoyl-tripeptide--D-alanyl-D-alanine ligase, partial [Phototrophicaceae bacterium]|nr:UDP-N-acetylmuramoyl-tripeptide--D-alanyl-D-alanine ligase [Phototrophicaceae bacterium]